MFNKNPDDTTRDASVSKLKVDTDRRRIAFLCVWILHKHTLETHTHTHTHMVHPRAQALFVIKKEAGFIFNYLFKVKGLWSPSGTGLKERRRVPTLARSLNPSSWRCNPTREALIRSGR